MEFHGTLGAPISLTRAVPCNFMELRMCQFRWHEQFHAIPWKLKCANFADMRSSMEFHGTLGAPISLTRAVPWNSMEFHGTRSAPISMTWVVPWNSMELWVRQFRWHEQFHGTWSAPISLTWEVPWNSMKFYGTLGAPILLTRAVPCNFMELRMRQFRWHEQFHGNQWNSMELRVRQFRWHEQLHGIPWNLKCANFDDMSSSMEFHGTFGVPISMTREVPWNSMELRVRQFRWHEQFHKFHGIPWNLKCANFADMRSSMEFHGIPWNFGCANFADTNCSMEFHEILWNFGCANFADTSSSM